MQTKNRDEPGFERAVLDPGGRRDERAPCDVLEVPRIVELDGDYLCYQYYGVEPAAQHRGGSGPTSRRRVRSPDAVAQMPIQERPTPEMLDEFLSLAEAKDPERIHRFARRWGVLHLCPHGLAVARPPVPGLIELDHVTRTGCAPLDWNGAEWDTFPIAGREPLIHWRQWATRARALLRITAKVRSLKPGRRADWEDLLAGLPAASLISEERGRSPYVGHSYKLDQQVACHFVNAWAATGRVAPMLVLRSDRPVVRLGGPATGRLFGLLGLQLMIRMSRVGRSAICSECGKPYKPDRAPNPSRASFCGPCRARGAPGRHAKARSTERMLTARQLHKEGVPQKEIALRVGSREATVRRWLQEDRARKR